MSINYCENASYTSEFGNLQIEILLEDADCTPVKRSNLYL